MLRFRILGLGLVVGLLMLAGATPAAAGNQSDKFVKRSGADLRLGGKEFRFGGTNNYYLMYKSDKMVDAVLESASTAGFDVVRTWAWYDRGRKDGTGSIGGTEHGVYFQYWDEAAGRPAYNDAGEDGLKNLDYVVHKAKQEGIRLVLPLTNNWESFGGMDQYIRWREWQLGSSAGLTHSTFYTDAVIRGWYKDWITHLLNRTNVYTGLKYKDDPTIMTWELANEPRCVGGGAYPKDPGCGVETLLPWVKDISEHIQSVDNKHLVSVGDEGFFCRPDTTDWTTDCTDGVDTVAFAALKSIDVMSFHLYPDHWTKTAEWGDWWIEEHAREAARIDKPVMLGEYGWNNKATRNPVFKSWLDTAYRTGIDGVLYWILSDIQDDGSLYPDFDGFTVYCPSPVCTTVSNTAERMRTGRYTFPPVADHDVAQTEFETAVTIDVTANDTSYNNTQIADGTVALATPAVAGGTFTAAPDGTVSFAPTAGFTGKASTTYSVQDTMGRTSNAASITVTVKPSPTAPITLFDFESGKQGWAPANWESQDSVVTHTTAWASQGTGSLHVDSKGFWFGADFASPVNLSQKTEIRYDINSTGTGATVALRVGPGYEWCQAGTSGWFTGEQTITIDLTGLTAACTAGLSDVRGMFLALNGGNQTYLDNIQAH